MPNHIPYVDDRLEPEELDQYNLEQHRHEITIGKNTFEMYVLDCREEGEKTNENPPLCIYCMGFGETDPVDPNELSAHIIERAKEKGQVLIIPRYPKLPADPNPDDEAALTMQGLQEISEELAEEGINIDFKKQDVDIIGFSDGGRSSVMTAAKINAIEPEPGVRRVLHQISPTSVVDVLEAETYKEAKGSEFTLGFTKQVLWISLEETRLRLNHQIELEEQRLEEAVRQIQEKSIHTMSEEEVAEARATEATSKTLAGKYKYPLQKQGIEAIEDPEKAFDKRVTINVVRNLAILLTTAEGRDIFQDQLGASSEKNLVFLADVIERALTASPHHNREGFSERQLIQRMLQYSKEIATTYRPLMDHFKMNEVRDTTCNHLETFEVDAVLPVEDVIFPFESFGRTVRKQLAEFGYRHNIDPYLEDSLKQAIKLGDDKALGMLFLRHPDKMGYLLFPRAKRASVEIEGVTGLLSGTHLAPLKRPENFIK